jgi:molecular chaperone DnaJ
MAKRDYYEILCVIRTVSDDDLKKAYRKLAIQHHPDRNPGDKTAEEAFKEVNEAYQILSDPQKRGVYDQFGHAGFSGGGGSGFDGFTGSFTDIFDNIFGDIFGGGGTASAGGVDLRYNLEISFEEAAFGIEKTITFEKESSCELCQGTGAKAGTKPKACRTCRGTGQVRFNQGFFTLTRPCATCAGRGVVIEERCEGCRGRGRNKKPHAVNVKIPPGVDSNQRLRLRGEGEVSEPGGRAGDLYVILKVEDHPLFKREEEHVILDLPITFVQAALGAEIDVPTLLGKTSLKVATGTQSGEIVRLKGKGIKRLNGSGFGDELVRIIVETPMHLTPKQKEILKQFEEESTKESHPGITHFVQKFKEIFKT